MKARTGGRLVLACAIALAVIAPAGARATTAAEALAFLNTQRALNGIPEVTSDAGLSQGCANHTAYMGLNGFGHGETAGNPGYTAEGVGTANKNELLIQGVHPWSATVTPWVNAPLHEYLEFDARRTQAGYAEGSGFSCMRLTGDLSPRSPQSYAMTGSDPLAVPAAVRGVDFPFTPHELLGIPADTTTGPNIYLYVVGLGNNLGIRSASLTGPSGPVPIGTVTQRTPGGEAFFYGGGVLIPTKPLTPGASYRADVVWLSPSGRTFNQTFAIRTAGGPPVLGSQLLAKVVSGKVRVKVPGKGQKFVLLRGSSLIPVGSLLDTRRGTVLLTSATGNGSQAGQFSGSVFQVLQSSNPAAKGLTELRLKGGSFRRCGQGKAKRATAARRPRTIRKLRGNAHGSFRTRGRRAAATIRGTRWTVADRCDGTLTTVARGVVDVLDFRRKRTVTLKAGQRYLARARK